MTLRQVIKPADPLRRSLSPPGGVFYPPAKVVYAILRRAGLFEATRLLMGPVPRGIAGPTSSDCYRYRLPSAEQLQGLLDLGHCPASVGSPVALATPDRQVILATFEEQVVGYAWLAKASVHAEENFSRNRALGTAIKLPQSTAFIFNAWVAPEHRGQSLLASLIVYGARHQWTDIEQLATTMDWTNLASYAAFKKLGLTDLGIVARARIGKLQWVGAPRRAHERNIVLTYSGQS